MRVGKYISPQVKYVLTPIFNIGSYLLLRLRYPNLKYFKDKNSAYSQQGQDLIIHNLFFAKKKDGFFCDVGANHPIDLNNTYFFEKLGWSGVAFDPQSNLADIWSQYRTSPFYPYALSDTERGVNFNIVKDTSGWENMLSYIEETSKESLSYESYSKSINTHTLKSVFKDLRITKVDFLSIDVEGHELQVLKGINFNEVTIQVILLENNPSGNRVFGDQKIRRYLKSKNYLFYGRIHALDDIYILQKN